MRVLRENKDSVMAVLEAFVYDPLLNWRLIDSTWVSQAGRHCNEFSTTIFVPWGIASGLDDLTIVPWAQTL